MKITQIIKVITVKQYLPSTSSTQSLSNTKEPCNTRVELAHKWTIDLPKIINVSRQFHKLEMTIFIVNNDNNKKLRTTPHKNPLKNSKPINVPRKNTLIVGDSILKHVEGCCLNKRMKSTVWVRSIPGVSTNVVTHQVKEFLGNISPDTVILHHGTNHLKSGNTSEKIATDMVNLALTIEREKKQSLHFRIDYHKW